MAALSPLDSQEDIVGDVCQAAGLAASGCRIPCPSFIAAYSRGTQICAALDSHLPFPPPSLPTTVQLQATGGGGSSGLVFLGEV